MEENVGKVMQAKCDSGHAIVPAVQAWLTKPNHETYSRCNFTTKRSLRAPGKVGTEDDADGDYMVGEHGIEVMPSLVDEEQHNHTLPPPTHRWHFSLARIF